MASSNDVQDVSQCACGKHCRTNCPSFVVGLEDRGPIRGYCDLYDTLLALDPIHLRYCKVIFCRARKCQRENYVYTERETCQAPN